MPGYLERDVQEGLVNALIHWNYSEIGSEAHIDMYYDRFKILSTSSMTVLWYLL